MKKVKKLTLPQSLYREHSLANPLLDFGPLEPEVNKCVLSSAIGLWRIVKAVQEVKTEASSFPLSPLHTEETTSSSLG